MRPFFAAAVLVLAGLGAAQQPEKDANFVTVIDTDGKENLLKNWKILAGTQRCILYAEPKGDKPDLARDGQEYVEFREDSSTTFKEGILTLVPLSSVRLLEYDIEKKTVALTMTLADKKEARLTGLTKFVSINKFTVEGTVDLGDGLGTARIKYQGGNNLIKPAVKAIRLPFRQPAPKPDGMGYLLTGVDEDKTIHKVQDLKALYHAGGGDRLSSMLWFKETVKIPLAKILTMSLPEEATEWQLKLEGGKELPPLALMEKGFPEDGSAGEFVGLIGKIDTGYKLFPMHTFSEMRREGD